MKVMDCVYFDLVESVSEEKFLEVSKRFNEEFVSKQKGYIRREVLKLENRWLDTVVWENSDLADVVAKTMHESEVVMEFMALIDTTTMEFKRFNMIEEY